MKFDMEKVVHLVILKIVFVGHLGDPRTRFFFMKGKVDHQQKKILVHLGELTRCIQQQGKNFN